MIPRSQVPSAVAIAEAIRAAGQEPVILSRGLRSLGSGQHVIGPVRTAWCDAGDNLAAHQVLDTARAGDVLVIAVEGDALRAVWGELMQLAARRRGVAAVIVDGFVRDTDPLRRSRIPVWSRGVALLGASKRRSLGVDLPVSLGGVTINPGDLVVADDDGIVVLPAADRDRVLRAAEERMMAERTIRRRVARGDSLLSQVARGAGGPE